ncbi:MAG: IS21 family transposase [Clostridia bacterium]|nr:IS21 family transposase [Clostridia bacterium]
MRCLESMIITEILRMKEMQFTLREIGEATGCSKTTAGEILSRCKECGLTYEEAVRLSPERINELIYPDSFGRKQVKDEPDFEVIHKRLLSSRRINLQYIWQEEYRKENPDGYSYSRFCAKYNDWKDKSGKNVILPQEREPGKELFIDWIGDKLPCVVDYATGEIHEAHFFVTTLGDSSYPFVEAFPDETQMNWNQAHIDAFEWYGGLPRILVPDNCKTAVIHTHLYNPQLNHAYRALARHYQVAIIPARVRKPKDKPSVESSVGWLETWLLEWLKNKIYYSFEALNHDIRERVLELVQKNFKHRPGSRKSVFEALDKPALRPLPKDVFESFETVPVSKVINNYHVVYDGFYYSVPYSFYNQSVMIHAFAKKIEVYDTIGNRIAFHTRHFSGKRYVTELEHMPDNHKAVVEFNSYNGAYYRYKASKIGTAASRFVDLLLTGVDFEEQAYKSCMAVINFSRSYGSERINRACEKAISLHSVNYTTLRNILKNGQDKQPVNQTPSDADTPTPYHENLRIGEWK